MLRLFASFLFVRLVYAFTPSLPASPSTCEPYTVSWGAASTDDQIGPPFNLLIVPVNDDSAQEDTTTGLGVLSATPVQWSIPDSNWDQQTTQGSFTIDAFPFPPGLRFIVVMDDGYGASSSSHQAFETPNLTLMLDIDLFVHLFIWSYRSGLGTGGVSQIQRVNQQAPSSTSCIPPEGVNPPVLFGLNTRAPAQCSMLTILSAPPKAIRGFIPGGSPFSLDLPPESNEETVRTNWDVNIVTGTSFVLALELNNGTMATTGLLMSHSDEGYGDACLANAPRSTVTLPGTLSRFKAAMSFFSFLFFFLSLISFLPFS